MKIKKQSGEWVSFDRQKLIRSLINSGANNELANDIVSEIEPKIHDGATIQPSYRQFTGTPPFSVPNEIFFPSVVSRLAFLG